LVFAIGRIEIYAVAAKILNHHAPDGHEVAADLDAVGL
jgi:hypothetical protein